MTQFLKDFFLVLLLLGLLFIVSLKSGITSNIGYLASGFSKTFFFGYHVFLFTAPAALFMIFRRRAFSWGAFIAGVLIFAMFLFLTLTEFGTWSSGSLQL